MTAVEAFQKADIGEDSSPEAIVTWALDRFAARELVVTTSFGMEGCALIDMVARHGRSVPVVYLDTMFLFPETLELRDRLIARYPHLRFENRGTTLTPEQQKRFDELAKAQQRPREPKHSGAKPPKALLESTNSAP